MVYLSVNIVNLSLSSLCLSTNDKENPILQAITVHKFFVKCTIVFWWFLVVDFDCQGAQYGELGICFYPLDCKRMVGTTEHPLEVM
jgi:hypothetical protein